MSRGRTEVCGQPYPQPSMHRALLTAAATAGAVAALAAQEPTVTATDAPAWTPATVTITPGQTVTFAYPAGASRHNLVWEAAAPAHCDGTTGTRPGWKATCRFDAPGRYPFVCAYHADVMTGEIVVAAAPTPTPTPTATASPQPSASPPPAAATPAPTAAPTPAPTLRATVAKLQRGGRVRGTVKTTKGARLAVRVTRRGKRVARTVKTATATTTRFSVKTRPARVRVVVTLTPPGVTRTFTVTVRK